MGGAFEYRAFASIYDCFFLYINDTNAAATFHVKILYELVLVSTKIRARLESCFCIRDSILPKLRINDQTRLWLTTIEQVNASSPWMSAIPWSSNSAQRFQRAGSLEYHYLGYRDPVPRFGDLAASNHPGSGHRAPPHFATSCLQRRTPVSVILLVHRRPNCGLQSHRG